MIFRTARYTAAENERVIFVIESNRRLTLPQETSFNEAVQLLSTY